MSLEFEQLKETWEQLGTDDPLWAVVSHNDKRGGKWNLDEFLGTGEKDVAQYESILKKWTPVPVRFDNVLDFGCGVGRLCLAWSRRANHVTGVDISESMLAKARSLAKEVPNIKFCVNQRQDLSAFPDHKFDLIASHICLQHMPWNLAARYVEEFGRICRPNGWVFQVPTRGGSKLNAIKCRLVESLPFGLDRMYRKWRHGSSVVFEMFYTPSAHVIAVAEKGGLKLIHQEPDPTCGEGEEGFIYLSKF